MNLLRKYFTLFFLSLTLLIISVNAMNVYSRFTCNQYYAKKNIQAGRKPTCGWRMYSGILDFATSYIPKGVAVMYWEPDLTAGINNNISAECAAMELNYYLYPATIYYREEAKITECDYILCQTGVYGCIQYRFSKLRTLFDNKNCEFRKVAENDDFLLLKRFKKRSGLIK